MPTTKFDKESIKKSIVGKVQRYNGLTIEEASKQQIYRAVASTVRDQIMEYRKGELQKAIEKEIDPQKKLELMVEQASKATNFPKNKRRKRRR